MCGRKGVTFSLRYCSSRICSMARLLDCFRPARQRCSCTLICLNRPAYAADSPCPRTPCPTFILLLRESEFLREAAVGGRCRGRERSVRTLLRSLQFSLAEEGRSERLLLAFSRCFCYSQMRTFSPLAGSGSRMRLRVPSAGSGRRRRLSLSRMSWWSFLLRSGVFSVCMRELHPGVEKLSKVTLESAANCYTRWAYSGPSLNYRVSCLTILILSNFLTEHPNTALSPRTLPLCQTKNKTRHCPSLQSGRGMSCRKGREYINDQMMFQQQIIFNCKMSTISPLRAPTTAQKRSLRESTAARYTTALAPRVLDLDSPDPNQEHADLAAPRDSTTSLAPASSLGLKTKLDILLKHNSQLLNENAQLSELVNGLRAELEIRARREETDFARMNQEVSTLAVELRGQQEAHQGELERLLTEVSRLHGEAHQLEVDKSTQLRRQQEAHERELVQQVAQMKRSQDEAKSLMELQISKLREGLELKEFEAESLRSQLRSEAEQLRSQNALLESELEHQRKLKDLELNETARRGRDDMRAALKHLELEKNVEVRQLENRILKLRKEVAGKDQEVEQLSKKSSGENEEVFFELSAIKAEKQALLEEIQALTESSQQKIVREKERISQLADLERENLESLFRNERESLLSEKQKLLELSIQKSEELKRLYENTKTMRESADAERAELKSLIEGLRLNLKKAQLSNAEETELLKVKMAQLHRADVEALSAFYEGEVAGLQLEVGALRESQAADREKLYGLLQENDELRKNFEVEISKQKAKIQDMKVKYAAARLEFKEQITSLGTKMELTSQSLIRETQQKQKGAEFFEAEKRKFYQLIEGKDKEIQQIHDTMVRLKELNEEEITQLKSQINMLRDSLAAKDQEFKDLKASLEQDFQRRSSKLIEEHAAILPDDALEKELHECKGKLTDLEKDNFKQKKELQFLARENRSLQQELGLRAGFIETMQLESSAAIEDEKSKVKILMGKNEVALKDYYENKLLSREHDNDSLRKQLAEKDADLRGIATRYSHLERRLRELMQANDKLTDFENKIVHLGLDQNLIKNMAELFRKNE